jgi:hypothetical protein
MKKGEVLKKLKAEAKRQGKTFRIIELARHTGVIVGSVRSTISRSSSDVADVVAHAFWDQFADELGKGWWRK